MNDDDVKNSPTEGYNQKEKPFTPLYPQNNTSVSVERLILLLRQDSRLIFAIMAFFILTAIGLSFLATPRYRVEVLLSYVSEPGSDQQRSIGSGLGGLAAAAGVNLGSEDDARARDLATLRSRTFTKKFLRTEQLLRKIFAGKWNPETNSWKEMDEDDIPTEWHAYKRFDRKIRHIRDDARTGLIHLSIEWKDREQAAKWANLLVSQVNEFIRDKAVRETRESIKYLNEQLLNAQNSELRKAITNLLERQIEREMLANIREEYAFRTIDRAVAPPRNEYIWPDLFLFIFSGAVFGIGVAVFVVILKRLRQQNRMESDRESVE
ncbi:MAG: Wzz/FepE/Etk N-terminal domain-containing protein [Sphingomonadales bacterium]